MPRFTEYDYHAEVPSAYANYMTLAAAMVERAVDDVQEAREYIEGDQFWREDDDKVTRGKRAWHWLTMPQSDSRISFAFLCDAMGVDIDHAQDKLIDGVPDRIIDILERQIKLKVRKKQSPRKERKHVGANTKSRRGDCNRRRHPRDGC
jgi:hypothetical protein